MCESPRAALGMQLASGGNSVESARTSLMAGASPSTLLVPARGRARRERTSSCKGQDGRPAEGEGRGACCPRGGWCGAGAAPCEQTDEGGCWSRLRFLDSESFLSGDGIVYQPGVFREHGNFVRFGTSAAIGRLGGWRRRATAERRASQLCDAISNEQFVNEVATHEKVAATTVVPYEV